MDFKVPASGDEIIFVYAETMLAKLQSQAGVNADKRSSITYIKEDDCIKLFAYTHQAEINPNLTDAEAIIVALGSGAKFWATSRLKVLRVSPDKIISDDSKITGYHPCPESQEYYNYVETNMLPLSIKTEEPKFDTNPRDPTFDQKLAAQI